MALVFNILALAAVCLTSAMQWLGDSYSFYLTYPWWDIPTHMLAGLTFGLWAAAVATRLRLTPYHTLLFTLGLIVLIGVAWEVWEVLAGVEVIAGDYWFDTIKDLIDDTIGALAAWLLYKATYRSKK